VVLASHGSREVVLRFEIVVFRCLYALEVACGPSGDLRMSCGEAPTTYSEPFSTVRARI
jgi:hypothetical protein